MKIQGEREVLLDCQDLVLLNPKIECDLDYIKSAISRHRTGYGKSWESIYEGKELRYIIYTSIPDTFKLKHNLPSVSELIDRIKLADALAAEAEKERRKNIDTIDIDAELQNAVEDIAKYAPKYNALFPGKTNKILSMAKAHSVLACCLALWNSNRYTVAQIHAVYKELKGVKLLKNEEVFRRRMKAWTDSGEINIVHAYTGTPRKHLLKVTAWHVAKIEQYYSNPQKYTVKMIHELLTAESIAKGKTLISNAAVAKYVAQPEVRNRLSVYRDKAYYRRNVQPSTRRLAPTFAADLYYADGSPLQIFCLNRAGTKVIRLNLFVVMDVKSKKIVGHDLAESEDRFNWLAAFKMAFSNEQLLPYEVMYDNASATKTLEFETLKNELLLKGCRLNPTTKGEPKQKANIERWFGTFQTGFQRMIEGYVGEGIRTKRDNGRIDAEHLAHVRKKKGHYSYKEMIVIVGKLIAIYNSKAAKKAASPNRVYSESEKPNATAVNPADIALLFWHHKKLKVRNSEVVMTVRHNEYYYEVYDHMAGLQLDGTQVKVYYDETDLSAVHLFDLNGQYIMQCRQKVGFHQAKANQSEADVLQIIKQSKHNEAKKTVSKKKSSEIAAAGMADDEGLLQLYSPFNTAFKDAINDAETIKLINYIEQQTGVDFTGTYEPVEHSISPEHGRNKPTLQERHSKKNIVPATLEVIERPK